MAAASSRRAVASPPSVTSCRARTPGASRASRASGRMLALRLQRAAGVQLLLAHAAREEELAELVGEQRRALHRQRLGEQNAVAGARRALVLELGAPDGAERRQRDDGAGHRVRHLGVAAGQRDAGHGGRRGEPLQQSSRLGRRRARREKHGREEPARLRSGGRDVVGVDEHGGRTDVVTAERDRVAVRHQELGALQVDRGDVLSDRRRHHQGGVAGEAAEERGQPLVGQLARCERQSEPDDLSQFREAADDEVAVGHVGLARLAVAGCAVVAQIGGHGAGRAPGLHVQQEVPDDECLRGGHAHGRRRVEHAVRSRLRRDLAVVARDDDVEVLQGERVEPAQRALHRAQPVAGEYADCEPLGAEPADERLGALVGGRRVRRGQLEALEGERRRVAGLAGWQREDPLEEVLVRRAADLALDGGEVERARVRERTVEVEDDRPEPERPRAAHAGAAVPALSRRRP